MNTGNLSAAKTALPCRVYRARLPVSGCKAQTVEDSNRLRTAQRTSVSRFIISSMLLFFPVLEKVLERGNAAKVTVVVSPDMKGGGT